MKAGESWISGVEHSRQRASQCKGLGMSVCLGCYRQRGGLVRRGADSSAALREQGDRGQAAVLYENAHFHKRVNSVGFPGALCFRKTVMVKKSSSPFTFGVMVP